MRKIQLSVIPCLLLVGCSSPSVVMVNDEAKLVHCAASGSAQAAIVAQNMVNACVDDYRKMGYIPVPAVSLGLRISDWKVAPATVIEVEKGSPAETSGFKVGDTILSVDGRSVGKGWDMIQALQNRRPGDTVRVVILREGRNMDLAPRLREVK